MCYSNFFSLSTECTVQEVASRQFKKCQFPFVFFDKTYYGCIKLIDVQNGVEEYTTKAWCSTKVDENTKEHIAGGSYYGDCPNDCESAEDAAANLQSGQFHIHMILFSAKVPILKEVNLGKVQLCRVEHFYNIFVLTFGRDC
jgi:hypothetical protein